ncbi:hypothetical protein, partial [Saliphagus infecundisoli]|uniref:hypothetical protein n=1 Tax=Saliphagus infecundisoli TaxID=1849069 RepID=UPI001CD4553D
MRGRIGLFIAVGELEAQCVGDRLVVGLFVVDTARIFTDVAGIDILTAPTGAGILTLGVSAHAEPPRERLSPTRGYSGSCAL